LDLIYNHVNTFCIPFFIYEKELVGASPAVCLKKKFSLEEGEAFEVVDNLLRGVVISVLADHLVEFYLSKAIAKCCGMRLRPIFVLPMLGANYMSWISSMTIRWLMTVLCGTSP
jgi:hypothetical protein